MDRPNQAVSGRNSGIRVKINRFAIEGDRAEHHFTVYNIAYDRTQEEVVNSESAETKIFDYTKEEITLAGQLDIYRPTTTFTNLNATDRDVAYLIEKEMFTVKSIVDKIYEEFALREWEGVTLKLKEGDYTKNNLPPKETIERIIRNSMAKRAIEGDELDKHNRQVVFSAFNTLLRKKSKTLQTKRTAQKPVAISTIGRERETLSVSNLRRDSSVFYTPDFADELGDDDAKTVLNEVIADQSFLKSSTKEVNTALFKTPVDLVFTTAEPERKFVELLTKRDNAKLLTAWVKSKNQRFYEIEYSITTDAGKHSR